MIVNIIESMVYAMANAAIRTPVRRRQYQAPRRVVSSHVADQLIKALQAERSRNAVLRDKNGALTLKAEADQAELVELRGQLAAASRLFRAHGLA
jgi:hypothetical protein